jgi:2-isopropylmalate synthase
MIELYDTTLRDGTQGEGVCLTLQDKLRITELLDDFGIDMIEGGWPGSNPKDVEYFAAARGLNLAHAEIAAFGSTCRPSLSPEQDENLRTLLDAETPVTTIFGKSWTRHVEHVLRTDLDNNLRLIEQSVAFLRAAGRRVIYDAEHFFDGFEADAAYAIRTLQRAVAGGADTVVLCDTNGGTMPWRIEQVVRTVAEQIGVPLGIHAHNDSGCAVANSITATRVGARHVQGTINGIGERCGNADLCTVIANLQLKTDAQPLPEGRLSGLYDLSHAVREICNLTPVRGAPYVGRSAFAHKGGVHVAAIERDAGSYEHVDPNTVGNETRVLVSELSGRGNISRKANEYGFEDIDSAARGDVLARIKKLEHQGYSFEAAEGSVELMMRRSRPDYHPFFELIDFMVVVEHREGRGHLAEANVKLRAGDRIFHTAAEGVGPVGALDLAMRKALVDVYPEIGRLRLVDYKVRILNGRDGTRAVTRVLIDFSDGEATWSTVGASANIIEASWAALSDSIEYGLHRTGATCAVAALAESA